MDHLINGYRRFRDGAWPERQRVFEHLAEKGQKPRALIISCVDSRVDPGMIFDAGPGELLVVRNVANLVPPYAPDSAYHGTSAAIEFGVRVLEIPLVVVMGHGQCGGVHSLINGAPEKAQDFVAPWISLASPALERAKAKVGTDCSDIQLCCEREVVKTSIENLLTFPWLRDKVEAGTLDVIGAWFAIHTGRLEVLQGDGTFASVE